MTANRVAKGKDPASEFDIDDHLAALAKSKADKQLETAQNALKERALQDQKLKTKCDEDETQ